MFQSPDVASAEQITDWINRVEKAVKDGGTLQHGLHETIKSKIDRLRAVAQQSAAIERLKAFANSDLLTTTYVYIDEDPDSRRENEAPALYYSSKSYEAGNPRHIVNYYADYTLAERTKNFGGPKYESMQVHEAGHSVFGKWLRENLRNFEGRDFAPSGTKLLDQLAKMPDDRTDPIFKASLLKSFLEVLLPASESLQAGYGPALQKLGDSGINFEANWFQPGDGDAEVVAARDHARQELGRILQWHDARDKVRVSWLRLYGQDDQLAPLRWVGWWMPGRHDTVLHTQDCHESDELIALKHDVDSDGQTVSVQYTKVGAGGRAGVRNVSRRLTSAFTPAIYAIKKDKLK